MRLALRGQSFSKKTKSGNILLTTDHALWVWDSVKNKTVTVAEADAKYSLDDVAYNPHMEDILLTAQENRTREVPVSGSTLIVRKGQNKAGVVFTRRIEWLRGMAFDEQGNFYFGGNGDLWVGEIGTEDEGWAGILTGYRYAPLATFETAEHNGVQETVSEVAVCREWLYLSIGNRYGSSLVRMPKPEITRSGEEGLETHQDLRNRWPLMSKALLAAEIVAKPGTLARSGMLCVSPDGRRIVYQIADERGRAFMLMNNEGGPPQEIARFSH